MLAQIAFNFFETAPSTGGISTIREVAQILTPFVAIAAVILTVNWNDRKARSTELLKRLCTGLDDIEKSTDALLKLVESYLTVKPTEGQDFQVTRAKITMEFNRLSDQVTILALNFDDISSVRMAKHFEVVYQAVFEEPFGLSDASQLVDGASARVSLIRENKKTWVSGLHRLRHLCLFRKIKIPSPRAF